MARMNEAMNDLFRYDASMLPRMRSTFNRSHSKGTTFDSGYLVPILIDDILPGDEVKLSVDALVRMATPIHPTMDTAYLDIFAFYCPYRVVWDNARSFYGENLDAEYNDLNEYKVPSFQYTMGSATSTRPKWTSNSLLDYMEYPYLGNGTAVSRPLSVLPFRVYQKIWNDWYRASEIQSSVKMNYGDTVTSSEISNGVFQLRKVDKLHDRFTSLLPSPQAGDSVLLPFGDTAPVYAGGTASSVSSFPIRFSGNERTDYYLRMQTADKESAEFITGNPNIQTDTYVMKPNNLYADLTRATSASINDLRIAVTTQQALEQIQRGGLRYNSIIFSMFGVATPDDVLQRPQLLGSHRQVVGMRTVAQTADTANGTVGELGAYSATRVGNGFLCDKAFTEPGYLMVLACVRPLHTYSQGYPDHAKKLSRFDHYFPVFNNIGNQPVYTDSVVAYSESSGSVVDPNRVLGYQPAWTEYRVKENKVTGLMRPDVPSSLGYYWTYADDFGTAPILNDAFVREDPDLIDRTIAVPDQPQFIGDFYFNMIHTRPMGVTSTPGLTRF